MAAQRGYLYDVVLSSGGIPVAGVSVQINQHGGGASTLFTTEAGGTTQGNPMTTGADGSFSCWVPEGSYDVVLSGAGFTTQTVYRDILKASNEPGPLLTTLGDMVYASAGNQLSRLGIGATGNALQVLGGVPAWGSLPIASISGYPSDATKFVRGDGTWQTVPGYLAAPQKYNTLIDIVSSTTETDILQAAGYSIPGNTLGPNGRVRVRIDGDYLNNTGGNAGSTPRIYWGGTKIMDIGTILRNSFTPRAPYYMEFEIFNNGLTNQQFMTGRYEYGNGTATTTGIGSNSLASQSFASSGVLTVDTTSAAILRVTEQLSVSNAAHEMRVRSSVIEFF